MKKLFLVGLILAVASAAAAQSNDFGQWFKVTKGGTDKIPWYTYSKDALFVDARYNFDWANATSVYLGRNATYGTTTVTYELGAIAGGGHGGISPEILTYTENGNFSVFTLNQVAFSTRNDPHFAYHYGDMLYRAGSALKVGFDEQLFYEKGGKIDLDLGPVVKVTAGRLYLKVWWSVNPTAGPQKTQIGLGANW